ncbi:MoaA/NifB/PqqE/SkfB family radical SAM enzyme [Bradyrhizobium japonicum]
MRCTYCYVPFDHRAVSPTLPFQILARLHELGATVLTISGANPFLFTELRRLLGDARKLMRSIHLDTNLIRNDDDRVFEIAALVDLLGVPLDGSVAATHDHIRSTRGHHTAVCRLLPKLIARNVNVKINTVVTAENHQDLTAIAVYIQAIKPKIWSIYEFWPMERGGMNRIRHQLSNVDFRAVAQTARKHSPDVYVEINSVHDRAPFYFFVNDLGVVYTIDPSQSDKYVFIGSIFLDKTIDRWHQLASGSIRENGEARYAYANETNIR